MAESSNIHDRNFLSPLNWKFQIKRAPSINYHIQEINIPDISFTKTPYQPTPFQSIPLDPDHMEFGPLDLSFKVDEDLQNMLEIFDWMIALGRPLDSSGYKYLEEKPQYDGDGLRSDISVAIQDGQHNVRYMINYIDAFPTKLGGFKLITTDQDVKYATASTSFKYTYYEIKRYDT